VSCAREPAAVAIKLLQQETGAGATTALSHSVLLLFFAKAAASASYSFQPSSSTIRVVVFSSRCSKSQKMHRDSGNEGEGRTQTNGRKRERHANAFISSPLSHKLCLFSSDLFFFLLTCPRLSLVHRRPVSGHISIKTRAFRLKHLF
jgi:hypothetical protein